MTDFHRYLKISYII